MSACPGNPWPLQRQLRLTATTPACDSDASLPNALNVFYSRFEAGKNVVARKNWILDFLMGRPQTVCIWNKPSSTTILSTGATQSCVPSLLLFILLTHNCTALHESNHIINFADDMAMVGLINKNLSLNIDKTKEMVVDLWRTQRDNKPLNIHGSTV